MKDEFEKYMVNHRDEFDTAEPDKDYLWEGIQLALLKKKYKRRVKIWQVAAVLFGVIAVGQLTYLFMNPVKGDNTNVAVDNTSESNEVNGAFEALEANYQQEVEVLQNQVQSKKINPSEYAILFEELDYIEEVEGEFRSDIPLVNDKERLAEILVDTYEKKIKLLERLLEQIERDELREQQFREL